jgi:hypothetical protein
MLNSNMKVTSHLYLLLLFIGCSSAEKKKQSQNHDTDSAQNIATSKLASVDIKTYPVDFVPNGYRLYSEDGIDQIVKGDLNKDGREDVVFLIKKQEQANIVKSNNGDLVDRNRRGIVVLFSNGNGYELAAENLDCFSSENEEGGVYYAPELYLEIVKGNLLVKYAHGRYGNWEYIFKLRDNDFELIGYDESNYRGPVIESTTSINFLTKKKQKKTNTNADADGGQEVFEETWTTYTGKELLHLSTIRDFDTIEL